MHVEDRLSSTLLHAGLKETTNMSVTSGDATVRASNASGMPRIGGSATLVVGNTYQRLRESEADMNRKGTNRKVHDWVLFVDVVQGDPDLIKSVEFDLGASFQPGTFTKLSPVHVILSNGSRVSRFSTRQQSTATIPAKIRVMGRGGSIYKTSHSICARKGGIRGSPVRFVESRALKPLENAKLPNNTFGIEIELSTASGVTRETVAKTLRSRAGVQVSVFVEYRDAHTRVEGWKLVHDGSISCSANFPNCTKFELVSPVLRASAGLNEVRKVLESLRGIASDVNKSMGFHCHVGVDGMGLSSLTKVCQNFIKYEDCLDTLMPPSRRTNSPESRQYFKSNKSAVAGATNKERHEALEHCASVRELARLMNPSGRYYKLNLQNLVTERQPTIEFRQHSATINPDKVDAWVRFCLAMVSNSARLPAPRCLKRSRGLNDQFDFLFEYVIKDRVLRDVYARRRNQVATDGGSSSRSGCCDGCANGSGCQAGSGRNFVRFLDG